jgi:hypothetical protein
MSKLEVARSDDLCGYGCEMAGGWIARNALFSSGRRKVQEAKASSQADQWVGRSEGIP